MEVERSKGFHRAGRMQESCNLLDTFNVKGFTLFEVVGTRDAQKRCIHAKSQGAPNRKNRICYRCVTNGMRVL
jgi:hypothetical protein